MTSSVLVTGGGGFVGGHLVSRLIAENWKVIILDNSSSESLNRVADSAEIIRGDIRDKEIVRKAVNKVDKIVHLAAQVNIPESIKDPQTTWNVNVDGTGLLLEEAKSSGVEMFVHASSCSVYGAAKYLPIGEKHPLAPISPYASSKLAAESLCNDFSKKGLDVTILRFFNIYGPGQKSGPYAGVIKTFLDNLRGSRPLQIYGKGDQLRDFIFVEDVIDAIMKSLMVSEKAHNILNIGSGQAVSINQLASKCQKVTRTKVPIQYVNERSGDIERSCADTTLMRQVLGFRPKFSLEAGLERTFNDLISGKSTNNPS